jgi:hypothetical protein
MKKFLTIAMVLVSSSAFAQCFNFMTGKGPQSIGAVSFPRQAKMVCLQHVQGLMTEKYATLKFSDESGPLGVFTSSIVGQGRCGANCIELQIQNGPLALISTQYDPQTRASAGVFKVDGRGFYIISPR